MQQPVVNSRTSAIINPQPYNSVKGPPTQLSKIFKEDKQKVSADIYQHADQMYTDGNDWNGF